MPKTHTTPPAHVGALRARIANHEPDQLKQVLLVRTVAIVAVSQVLPPAAVKGGTALRLRMGIAGSRFSKDLDLACKDAAEDFRKDYAKALQKGWEGFTAEIHDSRQVARPLGVPPEYVTVTYDMKISYRKKSLVTVPLEVSSDEIDDTVKPSRVLQSDISDLLQGLGFPQPTPVAIVADDHQIAQKLHAVSAPGSPRAHDLVDLQLLVAQNRFPDEDVADTCRRLFNYRRVRSWPPEPVQVGLNWPDLYSEAASELPVLQTVGEAVEWVNDYISRLAEITQDS